MEVHDLHKAYGTVRAVDGVSFDVAAGEIFGLLGRNGAGKTTTVECLQGLRRPDTGVLRVLGLDPVTQSGVLRRRVGSQLQESALPERIRVREALELFTAAAGRRTDWRVLLEEWGLGDKRDTAFGALSGGQRQRLFVALALANAPEVVFLDEMTTGLDPAARRAAWGLVEQVRDRGCTVVLVTHFMDEAEHLCDRVLVMDAGRVLAEGSPSAIVDKVAGGVRVLFSADDGPMDWLGDVPHVRRVSREGRVVRVDGDGPVLAFTAAALVAHGMAPDDLRVERPSLEDAFLALTEGRQEP